MKFTGVLPQSERTTKVWKSRGFFVLFFCKEMYGRQAHTAQAACHTFCFWQWQFLNVYISSSLKQISTKLHSFAKFSMVNLRILGLQPRDKAAMLVVKTKEIFLLTSFPIGEKCFCSWPRTWPPWRHLQTSNDPVFHFTRKFQLF